MRRKGWWGFVFLVVFIASANAQDIAPMAVSPGSESGVAVVERRCPAFSWSSVPWAVGYRVAVFEVTTAEVTGYEAMAAAATPVLTKEIQGQALSWTPSWRERLTDGGLYVWYVQALDGSGQGFWSAGKVFEVQAEKGAAERTEERLAKIEDKVSRKLKEAGVSDEVVADVAKEMNSGVREREITKDFSLSGTGLIPGKIGTQGYEGGLNTFYGNLAGSTIQYHGGTGLYDTFIGYEAGAQNTSGFHNTFVGANAGYRNTIAHYNTFIGEQAGRRNNTGQYNTYVGASAGFSNFTASSNTFIGMQAGYNNAVDGNTFVGSGSGYKNTTGKYNTFIGTAAGNLNNSGKYNTFLGYDAGSQNDASYNTLLGYNAGFMNLTGNQNTFVGYNVGYKNYGASQNTFMGYNAGYSNTGNHNTFLGHNAGYLHTAAFYDTFVGSAAGYNSTGTRNSFLGVNAGYNSTGSNNSFLGVNAGYSNDTGNHNTFLGDDAGFSNTIGSYNIFLGASTGYNNINGISNTFLGYYAGFYNTAGSGNVFLGQMAGTNETGSNKLYIDNSGISVPLIYGDFSVKYLVFNGKVGINGTNAVPTHLLDVGTSGAYCDGGQWVDGSSRAYKENIEDLSTREALKAFQELEPVKYNYKQNKEEQYLGFIAEDVPDLVATKDRKGLSPMDVVAVLTKVMQEQQKTIDELKKEITELKKKAK
jgi:hypothetical protein